MSFMLFKMTWHAVHYQIFEINSSKISFQKENFASQTPHHQFMKNYHHVKIATKKEPLYQIATNKSK